jgi:hypothetical protein
MPSREGIKAFADKVGRLVWEFGKLILALPFERRETQEGE